MLLAICLSAPGFLKIDNGRLREARGQVGARLVMEISRGLVIANVQKLAVPGANPPCISGELTSALLRVGSSGGWKAATLKQTVSGFELGSGMDLRAFWVVNSKLGVHLVSHFQRNSGSSRPGTRGADVAKRAELLHMLRHPR
jgi:hypothetical protein